jgi:uncharacterized iron-regulated membrane protein
MSNLLGLAWCVFCLGSACWAYKAVMRWHDRVIDVWLREPEKGE